MDFNRANKGKLSQNLDKFIFNRSLKDLKWSIVGAIVSMLLSMATPFFIVLMFYGIMMNGQEEKTNITVARVSTCVFILIGAKQLRCKRALDHSDGVLHSPNH